jgi:hypothetical protein
MLFTVATPPISSNPVSGQLPVCGLLAHKKEHRHCTDHGAKADGGAHSVWYDMPSRLAQRVSGVQAQS